MSFAEDGFALVERFVDDDTVDRLKAALADADTARASRARTRMCLLPAGFAWASH